MPILRSPGWLLAACALLLCAGGCDGDQYFSVFGYLDTTRNVQRVRVEALQDSMLVGADSTQVRATLTDLEMGETETMAEEIRPYGNRFLRNFRTGMDIHSGVTYRLSVERLRDGATSRAEVTIPAQAPVVEFSGGTAAGAVTVRDVERLGALLAVYSNGRQRSYLADTTRLASGVYRATISIPMEFRPEVVLVEVTVAGVSEDWPTYASPVRDSEPLPPAGIGTNVEHGAGYVGGTITRTVFV